MDKRSTQGSGGFTLIELLIVVSIILILAVIATPSFISALQKSRETSAVATIKRIYEAQMIYMASSHSFGTLGTLAAAGALDDRFSEGGGSPALGGYRYSINIPEEGGTAFYIQADPVSTTSGRYDYYAGPDGVVRFRTSLGDVEPGTAVQ